MSCCSVWLLNNSHRLIYSAGLGLSAYAAGFGNIYDFQGYKQSQTVGAEVYGYGVFVGLLAALKAYALPGKDLLLKQIDGVRSVSSSSTDEEMGQGEELLLPDNLPSAKWYPLKYAYLLVDHLVSFNNLCFMGNAIIGMIYAQQFATAGEASEHPYVPPLWSLGIYAAYYSIIDLPFITAVDGHTAHDEIFVQHDKRSKQEHPDRMALCFRNVFIRLVLGKTQQLFRVLGSMSHTATEVLPLLTAVNQWQRLRDMYNYNYQVLFWMIIGVKLLSFATVYAQTYYYEGREQKEAYEQFTQDDSKSDHAVEGTAEAVPSKWQYYADCFLQKTLWLSVIVHGASEGLSWLFYPASQASAPVRYGLAGFSVINEAVGNARSEYRETIEEINDNVKRYRAAHDAVSDDVSSQTRPASV